MPATPLGAGFYADVWGPLPFAIGPAPEGTYVVFGVKRRLQPRRLVARADAP